MSISYLECDDTDGGPGSSTVLGRIRGPGDLRGLSRDELTELAEAIRAFLVEKVSVSGGHLGPNLGVVELTIALHRVFESPRDALIFDTGHQAYPHKLLTGRRDDFDHLRAYGGLSGYPSRRKASTTGSSLRTRLLRFPMLMGWPKHSNWPAATIAA